MDQKGLWQAVLGELEVKISRANFATWFKNTSILSHEAGRVVVAVPNIFTKEWLEKKYDGDIKTALGKIAGRVEAVEYTVCAQTPAIASALTPAEAAAFETESLAVKPDFGPEVPAAATGMNSRYNFDSFVIGSSNQLAYAAAQAVAANPGTKYNPLFVYGGVGLGKTHLIQAIGNEILRRDPSKKIEYATSEGFTNEFVSSVSRKTPEAFTAKYRKVDVLIIDDIQFLGGKERTQEEFFHTFNALHHADKQIIMSSDKPPQAIPNLEDRLKSRFGSGMMVDIQPPDLETRAAILQKKAANIGFMLPNEVVEFLAKNIQNNIRELEGALTRLIAHCEFHSATPNVAIVTSLLTSFSHGQIKSRSLSSKTVLEKTAVFYDLSSDDITGPKRDREIVVPRQIAMYLMRQELGMSFPKIAKSTGGRDHTTAMHSVTKIERLLEQDESIRRQINQIKDKLYY